MTKDEALKLALEALIAAYQGNDKTGQVTEAITAIKQALAQPEPPCKTGSQCTSKCDGCAEPEPVGYFARCNDGVWRQFNDIDAYAIPLYTSLPKREWQGLTEDEINECFKITPDLFLPWHIYKRIEAKLKDKNT